MKSASKIIVLLIIVTLLLVGCTRNESGEMTADDSNFVADTLQNEEMDNSEQQQDGDFSDTSVTVNSSPATGQTDNLTSDYNPNSVPNAEEEVSDIIEVLPPVVPAPALTAPATPSFSASNIMASVVAEVSTFMTRVNGVADGLGYVEITMNTSYTEDKIITELIDMFRLEANTYGNTLFDLSYNGIVGSNHIFRLYRA